MIPPASEDDKDSDNSDNDGKGGKYEEKNQIIDGSTYYGDHYDAAYDEAIEDLMNNEDISDEDKEIIKDYFETIRK